MELKYNPQIKISVGTSRKSKNWIGQTLCWSEFLERLSRPVRTNETFAQYLSMRKPEQDSLKDVGGFVGGELTGAQRKNENAGNRYVITLDADNIAAGQTDAVINAVDGLGCAYAVYSTRKHEGAAPRLRILIPMDTFAAPDEYEPIARKMAEYIGMSIFDPTTFEAVRLMYWPSCSKDSQYIFTYGDKPLLSKQGMLDTYMDWKNIAEWPEVPGAEKIRNRSAKKQGNPLEKTGVVGAFCKVFDIPKAIAAFLPDVYEEGNIPGRYTYIDGSTSNGAVLYEDGNFLFSHHATDPAGGKLCNAFDLVRMHRFADEDEEAKIDTPVTNLPSFKAMCEFAVGNAEVAQVLHTERYEKAREEFGTFAIANAESEDYSWMEKMKCHAKTGLPLNTIENILIVLEHDPVLKGRFYHDEFANRAVITQPVPWDMELNKPRPWSDEDDAGLRYYMEKVYDISGKERIYDAMSVYATGHRVHRIRDYLDGLIWDGKPRIDTLLIDYFGAADTGYTRAVMRKTLTAAVARIYSPGCKFDSMLILTGPQGIGKSTFFGILAGPWYSDSMATFEGKDAAELVQGYWLIEAGELTGFNKSEMNAVKQFLSKREDVYRMPYGRRTSAFPRSCIIVGTTNDMEFLKDRTGNRRFWPVDLNKSEPRKNVFKELPDEVDQVWAEAVLRYRSGENLFLEGDVAKEAMEQQEEHRENNPKEGIIREFLEKKLPADWNKRSIYQRRSFYAGEFGAPTEGLVPRDRVCAAEIWCECFNGDLKMMRRADTIEINGILASIPGWEKGKGTIRFGEAYGTQKGYIKVM